MLRIHRIDLVFTCLRIEQEVAAGHHRFLVGQGELGIGLQRGNRRFEPYGSGDAIEHHGSPGTGQCHHLVLPTANLGGVGALGVQCLPKRLLGLRVRHHHKRYMERGGLFGQQLHM